MADLRTPIVNALTALRTAVDDFHDAKADLASAIATAIAHLVQTTGRRPNLLFNEQIEQDAAILFVGPQGNGNTMILSGGVRFIVPMTAALDAFVTRWTAEVDQAGVPSS